MLDGLVAIGEGEGFSGGDEEFRELRDLLCGNAQIKATLPAFVLRCRTRKDLWDHISDGRSSWRERRVYVLDSFEATRVAIEEISQPFGELPIASVLTTLGEDDIQNAWTKAFARCHSDPSGAITAARALVETVCKHILD
jgi:hypothetical protein